MSNVLKYIKDLEAAGFQRNQAEAQVQMVIDAIEGDLVTKHDFAVFKEHVDNRFTQFQHDMDNRFVQFETRVNSRFMQFKHEMDLRFSETEFRIVTRLGVLVVSTTSIAVAILAWLIKI